MKAKRTFADIAAARKRYNPDVEGYGDVRQWRGHFYQRMGWEEARRVIEQQERTPRQILGVGTAAPWSDIRSAFRKLSMDFHPDRAILNRMTVEAATEAFKQISAAYAVLEHEFGK
jgi:DnaJ-class molecular chaperone